MGKLYSIDIFIFASPSPLALISIVRFPTLFVSFFLFPFLTLHVYPLRYSKFFLYITITTSFPIPQTPFAPTPGKKKILPRAHTMVCADAFFSLLPTLKKEHEGGGKNRRCVGRRKKKNFKVGLVRASLGEGHFCLPPPPARPPIHLSISSSDPTISCFFFFFLNCPHSGHPFCAETES